MGKGTKKKDNKNKDKTKDNEPVSRTRASPRKEQSATARAGDEEEEATTSQRQDLAKGDAGVSGDDDGLAQQFTMPFTAEDEQISAFFGKHQLFYDMAHCDYKNKRKRELLVLQFAQSLFPSGKCFFLSFRYIFIRESL